MNGAPADLAACEKHGGLVRLPAMVWPGRGPVALRFLPDLNVVTIPVDIGVRDVFCAVTARWADASGAEYIRVSHEQLAAGQTTIAVDPICAPAHYTMTWTAVARAMDLGPVDERLASAVATTARTAGPAVVVMDGPWLDAVAHVSGHPRPVLLSAVARLRVAGLLLERRATSTNGLAYDLNIPGVSRLTSTGVCE